MKKLIAYLLALAGCTVTIHAVDETTPIVPVEASGYFVHSLLGATDNIMSLTLSRPPVAIGYVSAVTSNSLTVSVSDPSGLPVSPNWTTDQFKYNATSQRETYYAEFTEGPVGRNYLFNGARYKIIANAQNILTLETEGDDITNHPRFGSVQVGDTFVIRPYWRVRDVFGDNGSLLIEARSSAVDLKDDILIPDNTGIGINKPPSFTIYHLAGAGWRAEGSSADFSDFVLPMNQAFTVRRRNSAGLAIPVAGNVAAYQSSVFVPGGSSSTANDVFLSLSYPFSMRLRDSGLFDPNPLITPVKPSPSRFQIQDVIYFYGTNPGFGFSISHILYYLQDAVNSQWRQSGNDFVDAGDIEIPTGRGFILRKGVNSLGADWLMPVKRLAQLGEIGYPSLLGWEEITIDWPTDAGITYQIQESVDLEHWSDYGAPILSEADPITLLVAISSQKKFYRLERGAVRSGFADSSLSFGNDDNSVLADIGFPAKLGLTGSQSQIWVNGNGNLTFGSAYSTFDAVDAGLQEPHLAIIAPFFADVDTRERLRPNDGRLITYGKGWVDGRAAFGVNYVDVAYAREPASLSADATNSFQVILIDRSDVAAGDFDVEFNYDRVIWETASLAESGGAGGYGGNPARVGIADPAWRAAELAVSGISMEMLDVNPLTQQVPAGSLVHNARGSTMPGRYRLSVRSGAVQGSLVVEAGPDQALAEASSYAPLSGSASAVGSGSITYQWDVLERPPGASAYIEAQGSAATGLIEPNGDNLFSGRYRVRLTAWRTSDPQIVARDTVTITVDGDADGDGVADWEEDQLGTNRNSDDSDGDGVSDYEEIHRIVNGLPAPSDPMRADNPAVSLTVFSFVAP